MPSKASAEHAPTEGQVLTRTQRLKRKQADGQVERERLYAEAVADFTANLELRWLTLLTKAMTIQLRRDRYYRVTDTKSWWFKAFKIDVLTPALATDASDPSDGTDPTWHTQESLTLELFREINEELDTALEWFARDDAEQEAARKAAAELAQRQAEARAKLTPDDLKALGLK